MAFDRGRFCLVGPEPEKIVEEQGDRVLLQYTHDSKESRWVAKTDVVLMDYLRSYGDIVKWMRPNQVCEVQKRSLGAPRILARIVSVKTTYPRVITLSLPGKIPLQLEVDEPNVPYSIYYPYVVPFNVAYDKKF